MSTLNLLKSLTDLAMLLNPKDTETRIKTIQASFTAEVSVLKTLDTLCTERLEAKFLAFSFILILANSL